MIGESILHYRIVEKIGEGGMGVVYKAEDIQLKRTVALKFLPKHVSISGEDKARFAREAQAAASLDHPNICTVYQYGEDGDNAFIAMSYLPGESLHDRLTAGPLALNEAISIAIQIAEGLQAAHDSGIVHRDIKPSNITFTDGHRIKIVDFGLARLNTQSHLTQSGTTLGTVAYMSPEQAQGKPADQRSDIWSLGAVLYEMLTGNQPFHGDHAAAILYNVVNEKPPAVSANGIDIPMSIQAVIHKALEKSPDKRYQSVEEMLLDLRHAQHEAETGRSASSSISETARYVIARHRRLIYLGFTAMTILVAIILFAVFNPPTESRANHRIAILPFTTSTEDPGQKAIVASISDDLRAMLAPIRGLQVTSRQSSVMYEASRQISMLQIAEELNVDFILEANVSLQNNQIKIWPSLIQGRDDEIIWTSTMQQSINQLFLAKNEIARRITEKLAIKLTPQEERHLSQGQPVDAKVIEMVELARYHRDLHTHGGYDRAKAYYHQALALDSTYAPIYAGLARVTHGFGNNKHLLLKALQLDSTLSDVYWQLALLKRSTDIQAALADFETALKYNPSDSDARLEYAKTLRRIGRGDEAMAHMEEAVRRDPRSGRVRRGMGDLFYFKRDYNSALVHYLKCVEFNPGHIDGYRRLIRVYALLGVYDTALQILEKSKTIDDKSNYYDPNQYEAIVYAIRGDREKTLDIISRLNPNKFLYLKNLSETYAFLGENNKALETLQLCYDSGKTGAGSGLHSVAWDKIRENPRFQELEKAFLQRRGY